MSSNRKRRNLKVTLKDMCEKIEKAQFIRDEQGRPLTAREIYEYSPTGELYMILIWHDLARVLLKETTLEDLANKERAKRLAR